MATTASARAGAGGHKARMHVGMVTAVDTAGSTISIHNKKAGDLTLTVAPGSKVAVDGVKGKALTDVAVGMHVGIRSADGKTATAIHARTHVKHAGGRKKKALATGV